MSLVLLSIAIVVLLALRVPVAFAFLGPSLGYMWLTGQSVGLALRLIVNATASFPLLAVPLFVLLGVIANRGGIADRLFDFALALLGSSPPTSRSAGPRTSRGCACGSRTPRST